METRKKYKYFTTHFEAFSVMQHHIVLTQAVKAT